MPRRKRLIEVAFPLEEVSEHSRRDKYIRHGHISTLHIWWARRPLAACRAFIYASLVDDPADPREREALLKEVADLANWDAVRKPTLVVRPKPEGSGLTGEQLLANARRRILACNGGVPPRLLDPFAGGGAIPLEAMRLGCVVEASDLNPVAVLILKSTIEYPQRYGRPLGEQTAALQRGERDSAAGVNGGVPSYVKGTVSEIDYINNPLATDVRYWGNWMLGRARADLSDLYPSDSDGSVPIAYFWSRAINCPNCGAQMPLLRQYWLAQRGEKKVALFPIPDTGNQRISFRVVEGVNVVGNPTDATTSRGDTLCLLCKQVVKAADVRRLGREGQLGQMLTAVALKPHGRGGKHYRASTEVDLSAYDLSSSLLVDLSASAPDGLSAVPDEPIAPDTLGLRIDAMGFERWGQLFNDRQLVVMNVFSRLVCSAHEAMLSYGIGSDHAKAVATYLGIVTDRLAVRGCNQCIYNTQGEKIENEIARGVLPPVWDYVETVPIEDTSGSWSTCLDGVVEVILHASFDSSGSEVFQRDICGTKKIQSVDIVITDPPYYAAVDYAGLSDFFYVWMKRSVGFLYPDLLNLPLSPKRQQAIMASESNNAQERSRYVGLMQDAFGNIRSSLPGSNLVGVVFANTDPDAWSTLFEGLLSADLVPHASWPIDTEMQSGMAKVGQARLKTSVWMACRPREIDTPDAFLADVLAEMQPVIRERLLYFWSKGIRGADFFISAIGPALSVFGRHTRVFRPDGSAVTVRDFLDLVRRESTQVALEQVLQGADLGVVDPVTRQYVTWVWSYSRAPLAAGEAIALCLATGADYGQVTREGSIAVEVRDGNKKVAKLRGIRERGAQDETLGEDSPARPAALIDQLQLAALLWSQTRPADLATVRARLGETRWAALRALGQAVAGSLPDGDEDRRLILGLLGSNVMAAAAPNGANGARGDIADVATNMELPGFERLTTRPSREAGEGE